jgi:iron complex outermembrane recepter protein
MFRENIGLVRRLLVTAAALRGRLLALALVVGSALVTPSEAVAQRQAGAPEDQSVQLTEVVVTAQKRSERLEDVPISVSAWSAETLATSGITTIEDLGSVTAGLVVSNSDSVFLPVLRGIGNLVPTAGNESSTAIYLDGVYVPHLSTAFLELRDIDRVEVLKGPQGTLFGRNASGGLINIFTRDPTHDLQLDVGAGYANYNTTTGNLYVAGGLGSRVAASFSIYNSDQRHGWGENIYDGTPYYLANSTVARSKWLVDLGGDTQLKVIGSYFQGRSDNVNSRQFPGLPGGVYPFYGAASSQPWPTGGYYDVNINTPEFTSNHGWSVSAQLNHDFGFGTFSSITSHSQSNDHYFSEGDFTTYNFFTYDLQGDYKTTTQEFQLSSPASSRIKWVGGLFYLRAIAGYHPFTLSGDGVAVGFGLPNGSDAAVNGSQKTDDYAAYAQTTLPLMQRLNLTLGARITKDNISGDRTVAGVIPSVGSIVFPGAGVQKLDYTKPTFKAALDYHVTDDVMTYASFSRGFKAGTFNLLSFSGAPAAKPEVVDAYEVGIKSTFLDRRLQVNAAGFYYSVKNPQVLQIENGAVEVSNAQKAELKGIDVDAQALLARGLVLRLSVERLNAKYTEYTGAPFDLPNPNPPFGTFPTVLGNASGRPMLLAPDWSYTAGLDYDFDTAVGHFTYDVNWSYKSRFYWEITDTAPGGDYGLVNTSINYSPKWDGRWELRLWGKNLTNKKYAATGTVVEGPVGYIFGAGAPLTYGATINFKL